MIKKAERGGGMSVIHVMDPQLTNMIAAGEVVDRPVNIVKECMENSLDAGASSIDVEVFEGGIEGVIVTDDGCGMDMTDAQMAFERHATSKLQSEEDLFAISTMGFRGEALPSIASVARVEMTTSNGREGTRVCFDYGEKTVCEKTDCPQGTRIEVRGLFVHTPARFKYLKKPAYEFSIISDVVSKIALSHPDIRISLRHDGRMVFQTSGRNDRREILYQMFGREAASNAVSFLNTSDDYKISGLAVQPKISRASKQYIYVSINGRLVRSWQIVNAVAEGYREYLPKDRYPIVYLEISVDPQLIDVNVHPNKWEVRISKEEFLSSLIIETLSALFEEQLETPAVSRPAIIEDAVSQPALNLFQAVGKEVRQESRAGQADQLFVQEARKPYTAAERTEEQPGWSKSVSETALKGNPMLQDYRADNAQRRNEFTEQNPEYASAIRRDQLRQYNGTLPAFSKSAAGTEREAQTASSQTETAPLIFEEEMHQQHAYGPEFFHHLRIIGQLRESYILCENPDGLVIIDQHAAQERANFERLMRSYESEEQILQPLMIPLRADLPLSLLPRLEEINASVQPYGLKFEAFGEGAVILREIPDWMENVDKEAFLADLFTRFQDAGKTDLPGLRRHFIATMACHSSIRFNRPLTMDEMEKVIEDLQHCENPYHCPHGRPTVITFPDERLRKEFERG